MEPKQQGEYRNLTPQEIGHAVITFRKMLGMKQFTLAVDAGVDERTVQRIERGESVNEETLRKVAKVLGMKEGAFLGPRYVSTPEEARARVEKTLFAVLVIEANEFVTERDCHSILNGRHGYIVNDQRVGTSLAEEVAAFKDLLVDCGDCYNDLSHTERLESCRLLLDQVHKIEAAGYLTKYAVYTTDDKYEVSTVMFVPKSDERLGKIGQFVVPRNFSTMTRW